MLLKLQNVKKNILYVSTESIVAIREYNGKAVICCSAPIYGETNNTVLNHTVDQVVNALEDAGSHKIIEVRPI